MNQYTSTRNQSCPNLSCKLYQQSGMRNVHVHGKTPQRLRCSVCKKTWVTHRASTAYRLQFEQEKVKEVLELLSFGISVRRIATRTKLSPSTVQRWKTKFSSNS